MRAAISERLERLEARLPRARNYEEFVEWWKNADELSRSLLETALSCPELLGESGRQWEITAEYLRKMGVQAEPFTIADMLEDLRSDT